MMQKVQKGTHPAATRHPSKEGMLRLRPSGLRSARPGILSAAQAKSKEGLGCVIRFVRCRSAAATALGAAFMSLMSLGGFALTSDHTSLVYQRDTLKAATEAASFATSRHWQQALSSSLTDAQIKAALLPIAERYIRANIPAGRRDADLTIQLTLHHGADMVDVDASADLSGGVLFSGWLLDADTAAGMGDVTVETRTERIEEDVTAEVVLAIDVTTSMNYAFDGKGLTQEQSDQSRIEIVKQAALKLVDIVAPESGTSVAIGVVPWDYRIRLDTNMQTRWEDNSWAQYPTERYYERPYKTSTAGESQTLPSTKPEAWKGCLDQRALSGTNPPGLSAALPGNPHFFMAFYTPMLQDYSVLSGGKRRPIAYECHGDDIYDPQQSVCYSDPAHFNFRPPQFECPTPAPGARAIPAIMPLTTDIDVVKSKIEGLVPRGTATNSTLGVAWGHRLLAHSWKIIWGDATHPVNPAEHPRTQKVLVLLTDGADNYPDLRSNVGHEVVNGRRNQACTAAKNAGIKVYTIAAIDKNFVADLADPLKRCSSQADDPNGNYAFINNATTEDLHNAFQEIGRQIVRFRRVY